MLPALLALAASVAAAQAPAKGYVVRADSAPVWLDLTAADGAAAGRIFEIYVEGPELRHPVTGASLGRVETRVAGGRIVDVSARYSTGRLDDGAARAGQRVKLTSSVADAAPAAASPDDDQPGDAPRRKPKSRGAALDFAAVGMAVGDFDGIGRPEVALASENRIYLYAYPAADAKSLAEADVPGTGTRVLGLEAGKLDGDARDSLFVSVYDSAFQRFETRVYKLESGKWLKTAALAFLTRGDQDVSGARTLATQQVFDDSSFPFGRVYPLAYADGRYAQGPVPLKSRRADWLFGFTDATLGGQDATVLTTPSHALRVQFDKSQWRTPDDGYGQTPVRVRWGGRLLEFQPPLAVAYGADGAATVYAVRNLAALGGLGGPFGLFNRGEVTSKRWDGLGLENVWRAPITGCAQGLTLAEPAPGRRELLVAVRGAAGRSSVWVYDP